MSNGQIGDLVLTLNVSNQLGEGVQWDEQSQSIWWTDIESSYLQRYHVASSKLTQYPMPERVGCFAFLKGDDRLIIAFSSGIALFELVKQELTWLAQPEKHLPHHRFNDGRVDRQGRFWAGTMIEEKVEGTAENSVNDQLASLASLYVVDHQQHCQKMLTDMEISNGLCWSIDGNTLYHADSPTQCIYQYDMNTVSGQLSNKTLFAQTAENSFPDGSTIDAQGYLWNAQWGGARVVRYSPSGELDLTLNLSVSQPSCVAIGGPNMDWLIVTSAKQGLSATELQKQPQAGNVFIYQLQGISGLAETRCTTFT